MHHTAINRLCSYTKPMSITMPTLEQTEKYWADFFGLSIEVLHRPGMQVVPHCGLSDYEGAWLFQYGATCIVSVPSQFHAFAQEQFHNREALTALIYHRFTQYSAQQLKR